jgi:hypothetical protein
LTASEAVSIETGLKRDFFTPLPALNGANEMTKVWSFSIGRVEVTLEIEQESGYQYDGDDENGETQRAIDDGEFVAFSSTVRCYIDNLECGRDDLGGSVYEFGKESEFWTAHRDPDAMNRNCTIMREAYKAKTGTDRVSICHYFPGMIAEAIRQARECYAELVKLQESAA